MSTERFSPLVDAMYDAIRPHVNGGATRTLHAVEAARDVLVAHLRPLIATAESMADTARTTHAAAVHEGRAAAWRELVADLGVEYRRELA